MCVANGRDADRDRQQPAVLGATLGLEVLDRLAAPQPLQDLALLGQPLGRDDQRDRAPDRLFRAVAEHRLGRAVPGGDHAFERLADDRVLGARHDRGQPGHGIARLALLADVAAARLQLELAAALVEHGVVHPLRPAHLAVRPDHAVLDRDHGARRRQRGDERRDTRQVVRVHARREGARPSVARQAEEGAVGGVREGERAVLEEAADHVGLPFDHRAVASLAEPQRLLGRLAVRHVLECGHGSGKPPGRVAQRAHGERDVDARAVGTLHRELAGVGLGAAQHLAHRRVRVRQRAAAGVEQPVGAAVAIGRRGLAPPDLDGAPVEQADGSAGRVHTYTPMGSTAIRRSRSVSIGAVDSVPETPSSIGDTRFGTFVELTRLAARRDVLEAPWAASGLARRLPLRLAEPAKEPFHARRGNGGARAPGRG